MEGVLLKRLDYATGIAGLRYAYGILSLALTPFRVGLSLSKQSLNKFHTFLDTSSFPEESEVNTVLTVSLCQIVIVNAGVPGCLLYLLYFCVFVQQSVDSVSHGTPTVTAASVNGEG